jgi:hypothetical protein
MLTVSDDILRKDRYLCLKIKIKIFMLEVDLPGFVNPFYMRGRLTSLETSLAQLAIGIEGTNSDISILASMMSSPVPDQKMPD